MTKHENIFQKWVWEGLGENFMPDGETSIDINGDDVFTGTIFVGESYFKVFEYGLVLDATSLPVMFVESLKGMKVAQVIALPSCGNTDLDTCVYASEVATVLRNKDELKLILKMDAQ